MTTACMALEELDQLALQYHCNASYHDKKEFTYEVTFYRYADKVKRDKQR